jgi:formate hydrogenlyase subunit 4
MLIQGVFFGLSILLPVGAFMLLRLFFKILFKGVKRTDAGSYYASVGNRRAAMLIGFYEVMTPVLKLALIVFGVSMPVFIATAGSNLSQFVFKPLMASVVVLFFAGLPWLAGRGYVSMEREAVQRLRQQPSTRQSDLRSGGGKLPVIDI